MSSTTHDIRVPRSSAVGYIQDPTINVIVGDEAKNQTFSVHQGLICDRSKFFKNAMKEPWLEAGERKVRLSTEEPEVFALYLELLYTNALPTENSCVEDDPGEYLLLSQLYAMAEMFMDERTKDLVLAAMLTRSEAPYTDGKLYIPGLPCVHVIYNRTPVGSPVRTLMVKLYTENNVERLLETQPEDVPKESLHELSLSLIAHRPLLKDHNDVKESLVRDEKEFKKQPETKDQAIKDLQTQKKALQAEKDNLQTQLKSATGKKGK